MKTYEAGKGIQGERENERPKKNANEDDNKKSDEQKSINTWKPNKFILQALDDAFYKSFKVPKLLMLYSRLFYFKNGLKILFFLLQSLFFTFSNPS